MGIHSVRPHRFLLTWLLCACAVGASLTGCESPTESAAEDEIINASVTGLVTALEATNGDSVLVPQAEIRVHEAEISVEHAATCEVSRGLLPLFQ